MTYPPFSNFTVGYKILLESTSCRGRTRRNSQEKHGCTRAHKILKELIVNELHDRRALFLKVSEEGDSLLRQMASPLIKRLDEEIASIARSCT
jgi:hypothetical protein